MADELALEPPMEPAPRRNFWRSRSGIVIIILLILVIFAGILSWWLAQGKISSVSARLDSMIYTVEVPFQVRMGNIYVKAGDIVAPGQPLAQVDVSGATSQENGMSQEMASLRLVPGMRDIAERLNQAQQMEKDLASRANEARAAEESSRNAMQDQVTAHVRAQLRMRSINPANRGAYEQARQAEEAARASMEAAKDSYEQTSRGRAAIDRELGKIRNNILLARQRIGLRPEQDQTQTQASRPRNDELLAPAAGRVLRVNAIAGQMAQAEKSLFIIQPTGANRSDIWIQAWFPLEDKNELKPGQSVAIKFENNALHVKGRILATGPAAEMSQAPNGQATLATWTDDPVRFNARRYLPVKIALDNPEEARGIEPGASVQCQIQTRYLLGESLF